VAGAQQAKSTRRPDTVKAIDYSLRRWKALTRFPKDAQLPVDNNWIPNQIRPIEFGKNNW